MYENEPLISSLTIGRSFFLLQLFNTRDSRRVRKSVPSFTRSYSSFSIYLTIVPRGGDVVIYFPPFAPPLSPRDLSLSTSFRIFHFVSLRLTLGLFLSFPLFLSLRFPSFIFRDSIIS